MVTLCCMSEAYLDCDCEMVDTVRTSGSSTIVGISSGCTLGGWELTSGTLRGGTLDLYGMSDWVKNHRFSRHRVLKISFIANFSDLA